jgi:hypothetical protein
LTRLQPCNFQLTELIQVGGFQLLEVLVPADGCLHPQWPITQQVFELPIEGCNHLVPGADPLNQSLQIALFPETTLVTYFY